MSVAVIGTVYVDIKGFPIGHFVPTGRNVGEVRYVHGGVARNIAEDVRSLGEEVIFVGLTDKSGSGLEVTKRLKERGINTDYVRSTADGMGTWLAVFDERGEVCASVSKRPNLLPICDILEQSGREIFQQVKSVLLEIDIDEKIVSKVFELAAECRVPVYVVVSNMTIARERMAYIRECECFVCNWQEAGIFFGEPVAELSPAEMLELLKRKLAALGLKSMVVTLSEQGAVFANQKGEAGYCPAKSVKVIDTTGAGDAFFAGVSVGLTGGRTLEKACQMGTEAAARVIVTNENVC